MSANPLHIRVTQKADADEVSIYKYIERTFGKVHADKFRSKLIELFHRLSVTPTAGRIAKNDHSIRVFVFYRQNKVVYKTTETDITIIRILNAKQK